MNPLKCKKYQQENKRLTKKNAHLEKVNSAQALKIMELEEALHRERQSHYLTLYTVEGMAEHCRTIGEFRGNWKRHLDGGLESVKNASREEQNAYLAKWGVCIEDDLIEEELS